MREEVDNCVLLCDVDRLHGLIRQMDIYISYHVIRDLREKGLGEELDELCDKAGRRSEVGKDRV